MQIAIQPTYSRVCDTGDALVRATRASMRIGFDGDLSNTNPFLKRIADRWYTRLIPASKQPLMEMRRNTEFLLGLGCSSPQCRIASIPVAAAHVNQFVGPDPYFVLFAGAGWSGRQWPWKKFSALAETIGKKTGLTPILCGSHGDRDICQKIQDSCPIEILSCSGRTSLGELTEIIRKAQFVVCNETSAIHIAAAVQTKSVCILGGGHYGRFVPYDCENQEFAPIPVTLKIPCYHCNWICPYKRENEAVPCIANISVEEVFAAVESIINNP